LQRIGQPTNQGLFLASKAFYLSFGKSSFCAITDQFVQMRYVIAKQPIARS